MADEPAALRTSSPKRLPNPAAIYLATLRPSGRLVMAGSLDILARSHLGFPDARAAPWSTLRYAHLQAIRAKLAEAYKPATGKRYLAAIKGVLREAWRLGVFPGEELERIRDIRSVPGSAVPAGRALTKGELKSLMEATVDGTAAGARDAAVITLGNVAALRRTEISGLSLEDARTEGDGIVVKVVGRGRKSALSISTPTPRMRSRTISRFEGGSRERSCGQRGKAEG